MPIFNNALAGASGGAGDGYVVERSVRFNPGDSGYLSRQPSSAGNRKTWTVSLWTKRALLGTINQHVLETASSPEYSGLWFASDNSLEFRGFNGSSYTYRLHTAQFFRDPSAWHHIVLNFDSTASTASDRLAMYINGVKVTDFANTVYPSLNHESNWNNTATHYIGSFVGSSNYYGGMITDVHSIDGQVLDPTSFTEFDTNGVLQPKAYSGTYGTNGFHLDFKDNSSWAALGNDAAGSNNWTVNNISASAPGLATANQGMDVISYSGNSATRTFTDLAFQPDFVWVKCKSDTSGHVLTDSVRGVNKVLRSDITAAEESTPVYGYLSGFSSNGFTLSSGTHGTHGFGDVNMSGRTYVAWCWKAGGAASSNTSGTITSSVSANTSYGFSIVNYVGTGANATVGHGLGAAPGMIIIKNRDRSLSDAWRVWHSSLAANERLVLDETKAVGSASTLWQNTLPTSTIFYLHNDSRYNTNGDNHIAYVWSEIAGFSKFGSYTGTSSTVTVTTGFKPRYVLVKNTSNAYDWIVVDSARSNADAKLFPNTSAPESAQDAFDFNDDGFTIKVVDYPMNKNGDTFIYAAFAAKPNASGIDSFVDSPSQIANQTDSGAGGTVVGNHATWNPLDSGDITLSNGNLDTTRSATTWQTRRATIGITTGKYYWEVTAGSGVTLTSGPYNVVQVGISKAGMTGELGTSADGWGYYNLGGNRMTSGTNVTYGASWTEGDIIGVAFDADNGTLTFYKNGVSQGQAFSGLTSGPYFPSISQYSSNGSTCSTNFGQRAFAYTAPSGYKSLNTANLPTPTIEDPSKYFDTKLFTGDGATGSRSLTGLSFSPDFTWLKGRSYGISHLLYDNVRGAGASKSLVANGPNAEGNASANSTFGYLESFDTNGFSIYGGSDVNNGYVNKSNATYASWNWDAGDDANPTTIAAGSLNSSAYDQSQTWSSLLTTGSTFKTTGAATKAFDGSNSTYAEPENNANNYLSLDLSGLNLSGSIEVYVWAKSGVYINGNASSGTASNQGAINNLVLHTWPDQASITQIYVDAATSPPPQLHSIKIGGKLLVDSGVSVANVPAIASQVRAQPSAGFSIVSFTGSGNADSVGHGLNDVPAFWILKDRTATGNWIVYTQAIDGSLDYLNLNTTGSKNDSGNSAPTSSVVYLGGTNSHNMIAYCFAPVAGYSAMGSYVGNGSADGPFVYTGFKSRFMLIKRSDGTANWQIYDTARDPYNAMDSRIKANTADAEVSNAGYNLDVTSNGFRPTGGNNDNYNASGGTYIYYAVAEHPFKTARAR